MELLIGSYKVKLDAKARTSLPVEHRLAMKVQPSCEVLVTVGAEGCIVLGALDNFGNDYLSKIQRLDWTRAADRALLRQLAPRTFRLKIDAQGRVTLPQALLEWAGLEPGSDARIQGMGTYLEIWKIGRLDAESKRKVSFEESLESRLGTPAPGTPSQDNG